MTVKTLAASITGTSGVQSISISDSHTATTATAIITATTTSLSIGSSITVVMGYVGDTFTAFTGYVKEIEYKEPELLYTITAADVMIRAVDFFIAASSPTNPYTWQNIQAEELIKEVLRLSGLTSFASDSSSFTFAISYPVEVNLTPAYDYARFIADIIAYNIHADASGTIQIRDRRPYPVGGDSSVATIDAGDNNVLEASLDTSDRDIRNKIIVYGTGNIHAEASAVSPYLPSGYYRTVVVSAPGVIDSQSMAQKAADYNLDLLNRLTQKLNLVIEGRTGLAARECVTVTIPGLGITSEKWYVYSIEHSLSKSGFTTSMELHF